jgi:hypothetical protein
VSQAGAMIGFEDAMCSNKTGLFYGGCLKERFLI